MIACVIYGSPCWQDIRGMTSPSLQKEPGCSSQSISMSICCTFLRRSGRYVILCWPEQISSPWISTIFSIYQNSSQNICFALHLLFCTSFGFVDFLGVFRELISLFSAFTRILLKISVLHFIFYYTSFFALRLDSQTSYVKNLPRVFRYLISLFSAFTRILLKISVLHFIFYYTSFFALRLDSQTSYVKNLPRVFRYLLSLFSAFTRILLKISVLHFIFFFCTSFGFAYFIARCVNETA
jgi:hypothetical protein